MYRILVVDDEPDLRFYSPRIETIDAGEAADVTGRIPSGIPGLDAVMDGGISAGEATVILGPSGAGKTIFGLNFVAEGLIRGERCLCVVGGRLEGVSGVLGWSVLRTTSTTTS